jgi:hypothetical protein
MHKDDFPAFTKQVEVLCAGFNVPPTDLRLEALWRGLQAMNMGQFTRVVEVALTGGTDKQPIERMPTTPQLWALARSMRAQAPARPSKPEPVGDRFEVITTKFLYLFLRKKGPLAPEALQSVLAAKPKLINDWRTIASEEPITDVEFGVAVYRRFAQILGVKDIPDHELNDVVRSAASL